MVLNQIEERFVYLMLITGRSQDSSVIVVTKLGTAFNCPVVEGGRSGSGAHQGPCLVDAGVKRPERDTDDSRSSGAEVKDEWSFTSTPPSGFVVYTGTTLCEP
jgi:hypothetical protein